MTVVDAATAASDAFPAIVGLLEACHASGERGRRSFLYAGRYYRVARTNLWRTIVFSPATGLPLGVTGFPPKSS
jgi:hypothetical protein